MSRPMILPRLVALLVLLTTISLGVPAKALSFLDADFQQGGFALGQVEPGSSVRFDGRAVRVLSLIHI